MKPPSFPSSARCRSAAALAIAALLAIPSRSLAAGQPAVQITNGTGCASTLPVSDSTGTIAAWQSDCDPAGTNADGSSEIFRATVGSAPAQLTTGTGCTSGHPAISADGSRVAFESDCNPTGGNPDGNVEIFLWKSNGTIVQLTSSSVCDNLDPSINAAGTAIAFDSTCNVAGSYDGHGSEIFRVTDKGVITQLTNDPVGACDSTSPSISANGNLVAFDSDCDLTGQNQNLAIEIFTVTSALAVRQLTVAPDDSCVSVHPSMSGTGSIVGFESDCDFTGANADRSIEIFTVDSARHVQQVTNAPSGSACASGVVRMASSGGALAYSSYCNVAGNTDGSIEVYQVHVGPTVSQPLAVTSGTGCQSLGGGISADGTRVMFDSDCDPAGTNHDGSVEAFRATACICGTPSSRKSVPAASDALYMLKAAVGTAACAPCECDTNSDGSITSSDALRTLKVVVQQPGISLVCPAP